MNADRPWRFRNRSVCRQLYHCSGGRSRLNRTWTCVELLEDYVKGAKARYAVDEKVALANGYAAKFNRLTRPKSTLKGETDEPLPQEGGKTRLELENLDGMGNHDILDINCSSHVKHWEDFIRRSYEGIFRY